MMKQGKIKNLIQLMNKIHSQKKQQKLIVIQQYQDQASQYQKQVDNDNDSAQSMSYNRNKTTQQDNNMKDMNTTNQVGIFFTQDAIKPRFDQKKTLYEVYRDSLQKKKIHLSHLLNNKNKKLQKTVHSEDQMRNTKDIFFPIRQGNNKLKKRRQSENYHRFKKNSLVKEHLSIPFLPHQTHSRNNKIKLKQDLDEKLYTYESMRNKKLDYKPMFRVKRIALQSYKTEAAEQEEQEKLQRYSFYKKILKVEQVNSDKNTYLREKIKDKKRFSKILLNKIDRFSAWDSGVVQKTQDSQLVNKLY